MVDRQLRSASSSHHLVRWGSPGGLRLPHQGARAKERQEDGALRRGCAHLPPVLRQRPRSGVDARDEFSDAPIRPRRTSGDEPDPSPDAVDPRDGDRILAHPLADHGFTVEESEVFGEKRLDFTHPCGIEYALVGSLRSAPSSLLRSRAPEFGIHGTHGITVSVRDLELSAEFMTLDGAVT